MKLLGLFHSFSCSRVLVAIEISALACGLVTASPLLVRAQSVTVTLLHSFGSYTDPDGSFPRAGLIQASDGNFYGTTSAGGGTAYRLSPTGEFATIHRFVGASSGSIDGSDPRGRLVQGADGNIYGTTNSGGGDGTGDNVYGTVFRFSLDGGYSTFHAFHAGPDGGYPEAGLTRGSDGNLYGTTSYGGGSGRGLVIRVEAASGDVTALHAFDFSDGSEPSTELLQASDGNFYGTTFVGGQYEFGVIFRVSAAGDFQVLHEFDSTDGGFLYEQSGLVQAVDGNLYGIAHGGGLSTYSGPGTAYRITLGGDFTLLHQFASAQEDVSNPVSLIQATDGNFYGAATHASGTVQDGGIFRLTTDGNVTVVYRFAKVPGGDSLAVDGSDPQDLIQGRDGSFYGVNSTGGSAGGGTIYKMELDKTAIVSPLAVTAALNTAFSYQVAASSSPTSFNATGLPDGLSIDAATGVISGTPTDPGTFSVLLYAANNSVISTASLVLTVPAVAPPVITSSSNASGQAFQALSYQVTATNAPTGYTASGLPAGLSIDASSGLVSGTPTVAGTFTVALSATNAGGAGDATLTLVIAAKPVIAPPLITSATSASAKVGQAFTYQIKASNSPASYAASGLPGGLSLNTKTGLITGTPTVAGSFPVTLRATNAGGSGSAKLSLKVFSVPTVAFVLPGAGGGNSTVVIEGQSIEVGVSRTGGDPAQALTVHYKAKGSNVKGVDYHTLSGVVTIPAGAASAKIPVQALDDGKEDGNKTLKLKFVPATDGAYQVGTPGQAKIRIIDLQSVE